MADATQTAASFGYSVEFFNSDPQLKQLLTDAVNHNYSDTEFLAKFRATPWFKTKGESARKTIALKTQDPATYQQQLQSQMSTINLAAAQTGAALSVKQVQSLAETAMLSGWNSDQIKTAVGSRLKADKGGNFKGQAGAYQAQFNQLASQYGISVSAPTMGAWVQQAVFGQMDETRLKQVLINQAVSKYPPYADRLKAGETMQQIADPYIQETAKLLEMNPEQIPLNAPTIQKGLMTKDAKGNPTSMPIWQFQTMLRQDPRWAKTKNAQDSMMDAAHQVLRDFGVQN